MKTLCVNSALLLVVVLFSTVQARDSRCYSCVSTLDIECSTNPEQSKFASHCGVGGDGSDVRCLKTTYKVDQRLVTKRECMYGYQNTCSQLRNQNSMSDTRMRMETCDECTGDLCNSSPKVQTSSVILGLSSMALFAFLK